MFKTIYNSQGHRTGNIPSSNLRLRAQRPAPAPLKTETSGLPEADSGSHTTSDSALVGRAKDILDPLAMRETKSAGRNRVATGPRTPQGKGQSKRNSLKHGIFSDVVVLPSESHSAFLKRGLQPRIELEVK